MYGEEEWNRVRRWEVVTPRTGVHWRGEYKGINTASTIIDSGAMCTGEGKKRVVHHEWTLERM